MKVNILSPHIDDAAFALANTISKCAEKNMEVTIINCFTVTKWTAVHIDNKDIESVSRLRKKEDEVFYKTIGDIRIVNLDLLDAPLRNGYIFQEQPFQPNELALINQLAALLTPYQDEDGLLLCPLAVGHHIDHAICRQAVQQLYNNFNVIFFEDLPYTNRISASELQGYVKVLEMLLKVKLSNFTVDKKDGLIDKKQAIQVYQSQLNNDIITEISNHFEALQGERLWGEEKQIEMLKNRLKD